MEYKAVNEKRAQIDALKKQIEMLKAKSSKETNIDKIFACTQEIETLEKKKKEIEIEINSLIDTIHSHTESAIDADVVKYLQIVENPATYSLSKSAWVSILLKYGLKKNAVVMGNVAHLKYILIPTSMDEVKIGKQIWAKTNLDVSVFKNGDPILEANTVNEWNNACWNGKPVWCYYDYDPKNGKKYGKLYNWFAVNDKRGLAPKGWSVPSEKDFLSLIKYVGDESSNILLSRESVYSIDQLHKMLSFINGKTKIKIEHLIDSFYISYGLAEEFVNLFEAFGIIGPFEGNVNGRQLLGAVDEKRIEEFTDWFTKRSMGYITNKFGYNGLTGGARGIYAGSITEFESTSSQKNEYFNSLGKVCIFWSKTKDFSLELVPYRKVRIVTSEKNAGNSVRCIKE
jgi:uncharacterized protein (TIGR02145 family)